MGKQWMYTDSLDGKPYPRDQLKRFEVSVREGGVTQQWALYLTKENRETFKRALKDWTKNEKENDPEEFPNDQRPPSVDMSSGDGLTPDERQALRRWEVTRGRKSEVVRRGRVKGTTVEEWRAAGAPMVTEAEYLEYLTEKDSESA